MGHNTRLIIIIITILYLVINVYSQENEMEIPDDVPYGIGFRDTVWNQYLEKIKDTIIYKENFLLDSIEVDFVAKLYSLNDSNIYIPFDYVSFFVDSANLKDNIFVSHNFVIDFFIYYNKVLYITTSLNKHHIFNDFDFSNEYIKYGTFKSLYIKKINLTDQIIMFNGVYSIAISDYAIQFYGSINLVDGKITIKD